ncbi:unnamed protein product [Pseudo-nitzschia multistriata]|uniref:Amino acid transporter transmembrane domain-containing protein n=1 Tax=Pseudo-nitzschia multistriata TaxID=183589 RepID=A0A448YZU5_9STRA|nr:unnamed protein product [Pseudo-nitzschia multistriata]
MEGITHRQSSSSAIDVTTTDTIEESVFSPLEIEESSAISDIDGYDDDGVSPLLGNNDGNGTSRTSSNTNGKELADHSHGAGPPGSAGTPQVIINIIISFVGAGLLGVPNAFSKSGWLLGSITLVLVSTLNVYAMLCLPRVQRVVQAKYPNEIVQSYGDVGRLILGEKGEKVIFLCLGISQAGFATAYIIFIAANLNSIYGWSRGLICATCVPGLLGLVQFRELASLSPFSLLANTANFCALSAVLFQDYEHYTPHNDAIHKADFGGVIYVMAVTIYSMEGVGLILSLKASCKQPQQFSYLLIATLAAITTFMAIFGSAGYWAFGDATLAPITLNLANHWSATFVKCSLCLGLYLTYPIMMFPIWAIIEDANTTQLSRISVRSAIVLVSALVAYSVPNFGKFLSLVGSSICTLLGFVFPSYFHLHTFGKELPVWQRGLDTFLLVGGFSFGCMGTYQSVVAMMEGELEGHH